MSTGRTREQHRERAAQLVTPANAIQGDILRAIVHALLALSAPVDEPAPDVTG